MHKKCYETFDKVKLVYDSTEVGREAKLTAQTHSLTSMNPKPIIIDVKRYESYDITGVKTYIGKIFYRQILIT